ncbi:MAG TPA: P27 family phage terminase small subunit [Chryseosolibacter sp.]|nr:P27 family phage terminase small subunit [Chryseosolibacter sp.]
MQEKKKRKSVKVTKPKNAKQLIITYLKKVNQFEQSDITLIDELVYQLELVNEAKRDIAQRGQMINLRKTGEEPYYQINFSVSIIQKATKIIQSIYKQLGLDVVSRLKRSKQDSQQEEKKDALSLLNQIVNNYSLSN